MITPSILSFSIFLSGTFNHFHPFKIPSSYIECLNNSVCNDAKAIINGWVCSPVSSGHPGIRSKTILEGYFYGTNKYVGSLTPTLLSLNKELFKRAMYENGIMKNYEKLDVCERLAKIDKIDNICFNGVIRPIHDDTDYSTYGSPTGWVLGFRIPSPCVVH